MSEVVARTPWGAIRGVKTPSCHAFLGVKYGAAPVGELRWKPPVSWRPTAGVYDATAFAPSPPQPPSPAARWRAAYAPSVMSEDCLNLNIWTPEADAARRPVLVHVFGGGFETGDASGGLQDGEALSHRSDAVIVRVNFRIGALGFLSLGASLGRDYASVNRGLLDLVLALGWIQENIAALGGDPDNVTLFGLSSGAFMIAALFGMPQSRGLFARAWMQSGSASRVSTAAQGSEVAEEFLRAAQINPGDVRALQALPVESILAAQRKAAALDLGDRNAPGGRTLGIVEDGASLPEHPLRALSRGDWKDIPIVLGFTRDEARLWFASGAMRLPASFEDVEAEVIRFAGDEGRGRKLFAFYRARIGADDPTALREAFLTDAVYAVPALRTARAQTDARGRAFAYRFDWTPRGEFASLGAAHGFDEAFVWNATTCFPPAEGDPAAADLAWEMSAALVQFARTGAPPWKAFGSEGFVHVFGTAASPPDHRELLQAWEGVSRR
jgi:para-nitrobenzyl esterase